MSKTGIVSSIKESELKEGQMKPMCVKGDLQPFGFVPNFLCIEK
ncbi:MAG: hypothetical protein ABSD42_13975 [Candidatus Bathyarchaeia archaeon]|jgi:hypothetical protein